MNERPSPKETLLLALDSITEAEEEMEGGELRHVAVVFSIQKDHDDGQVEEQSGWYHSADPRWLVAALLRRGADGIEGAPVEDDE